MVTRPLEAWIALLTSRFGSQVMVKEVRAAVVEQKVVVRLRSGLLARPAALFVQEANRFTAESFVEKDGKSVNAKSIMGIMSLAIAHGQEIVIRADGSDASDAVARLAEMVSQED